MKKVLRSVQRQPIQSLLIPRILKISIQDKLVCFSALLKTALTAAFDGNKEKETKFYNLIKENQLETAFPDVEIALRI